MVRAKRHNTCQSSVTSRGISPTGDKQTVMQETRLWVQKRTEYWFRPRETGWFLSCRTPPDPLWLLTVPLSSPHGLFSKDAGGLHCGLLSPVSLPWARRAAVTTGSSCQYLLWENSLSWFVSWLPLPTIPEGPRINAQPSIDTISLSELIQPQAFKKQVPSIKTEFLHIKGNMLRPLGTTKRTFLYKRNLTLVM